MGIISAAAFFALEPKENFFLWSPNEAAEALIALGTAFAKKAAPEVTVNKSEMPFLKLLPSIFRGLLCLLAGPISGLLLASAMRFVRAHKLQQNPPEWAQAQIKTSFINSAKMNLALIMPAAAALTWTGPLFKEALGFAQRASVYMNDSVHYSPAGYNEMGRTMALNICSPQRIDYSSSSNGGGSNAFLMYGNIGINTALPVAPFHANLTVIDTVNSALKASADCFMGSATSASPQITLLSAGSSLTNRGVFRGIASDGTLSAPTTVSNGRVLTTYGAGGYDGSALQFPTTIDMTVDSVVSSGSVPAAIAFNTGYNTATRNEKMRIDHNGNIGIGTTTPTTYKFDMQSSNATNMRIHNTTAASVNAGAFYYATSTLPTNSDQRLGGLSMGAINGTGSNIGASVRGYSAQAWTLGTAQGSYLSFYTTATNSASQTERMRINQDGTVNVAGLGTGVLYTNGGTLTGTNPSDSLLKNNIENLPYGLNELKQLNTKQYYYNNDSTYSDQSYGFIAQQVNRVIPAIVRPIGEGNLGLKSDAFIYISINAIKELSSKIDALEARIKILENK